jgi:hypothetical protein
MHSGSFLTFRAQTAPMPHKRHILSTGIRDAMKSVPNAVSAIAGLLTPPPRGLERGAGCRGSGPGCDGVIALLHDTRARKRARRCNSCQKRHRCLHPHQTVCTHIIAVRSAARWHRDGTHPLPLITHAPRPAPFPRPTRPASVFSPLPGGGPRRVPNANASYLPTLAPLSLYQPCSDFWVLTSDNALIAVAP